MATIKSDYSVNFDAGKDIATLTGDSPVPKRYVDWIASQLVTTTPGNLYPVVINFTTLPDGVAQQETVVILDISGTPPFTVFVAAPPELSGLIMIEDLPGGSKRFRCVPPFEGNTADVQKTLAFSVWNAHPDTDEETPAIQTVVWTIKASAVNAGWGSTTNVLPPAEVGHPYQFFAPSITGTGPYAVRRTAGLTVAALQSAGLAIRQASVVEPAVDAMIFGSPLPGSEGTTLAASITLGLTGTTGVEATLAFPAGITIYRQPGLNLQSIPVFSASTSFSFAPYLVGYPAAHISVASGYSLPPKYSLDNDVLTGTGLTSGDNGTSADIVFVVSNGYHQPVEIPLTITTNIATALGACPAAIVSVSKNARANGVVMSTLSDQTELITITDIGGGVLAITKEDGAGAAHDGPRYRTSGAYWEVRNGTGETRSSAGIYYPFGLGPKFIVLRIRMPDTQIAGESNVIVFGPSWLGFEKDAGGGGLDLFRLHTGAAVLASPAIDAIGNFVQLLVYVTGTNTAGIAYATDDTIDGDTGAQTVAGIDSAWDRAIWSPSYMQSADADYQCMGIGTTLVS